MSASSLATIFMTHLVCPRWLKPEELQVFAWIWYVLKQQCKVVSFYQEEIESPNPVFHHLTNIV